METLQVKNEASGNPRKLKSCTVRPWNWVGSTWLESRIHICIVIMITYLAKNRDIITFGGWGEGGRERAEPQVSYKEEYIMLNT